MKSKPRHDRSIICGGGSGLGSQVETQQVKVQISHVSTISKGGSHDLTESARDIVNEISAHSGSIWEVMPVDLLSFDAKLFVSFCEAVRLLKTG